MTFGEFCKAFDKPIKGLKGIKSKVNIVRFFLDAALGSTTSFEDSYYGKWFNDTQPITFWNDVCDAYDSEKFVDALRQKISPTSRVELARKFDIEIEENEEPDLKILAKAIAEQFLLIAQNSGSYDGNVVNERYQEFKTPAEWGGYVSRAKDNEKKCKTLFYRNQTVEIDSFYVWNRISLAQPKNLGFDVSDNETDNILISPDTEKLFEQHNNVLLIGMEGIGKTMMIRKLFLSSLEEYANTGVLPFLICLREYNSVNRSLLSLITEAINTYDESFDEDEATALLFQGKAVVYMDGLDEISPDQYGEFHAELNRLTKAYKRSKFLITTRNYTLLSASDFKYMWLLPFTVSQSKDLVTMLEIDEGVKVSLCNVISEQNADYKEYLSIPMLLTLFAMNYEKFDRVPAKRHELYEVAYDTLLEMHDRDEKDNYEKRFNSVRGADEFTPIFAEFCARTCRNGEVLFSRRQFESLIRKVDAIHEIMNPAGFSTGKFIDDVCFKACLMYEKERGYTFLHRSFQEYLFASYYAFADNERLIKLGEYLSNSKNCKFFNEDAFWMLYDMNPNRVNELLFYPYLRRIYEEYDDRIMFWTYLKLGYGDIRIRYLDEVEINKHKGTGEIQENARVNEPNNFLFMMITKLCGIEPSFARHTYCNEELEELFEDMIIGSEVEGGIDLKNVSERLLSDQHNRYDDNSISENGKTVIFGRDCIYSPDLAIKDAVKFQGMQELIYDKKSELWNAFDMVRDLFDELKLDYEYDNEHDDF
ncbi:MAG: NACHT domain-containing protein [Lachnospiraceae bacterium]|nr:NACHT domain-containing protein [Lachnospiraceae bacterium]